MRRYVIGLLVFAVTAAGAFAVFAGVQRNKASGNFDPVMSGVCRYACATKLKYDAVDVIAQPGAQPGKLTQCPVSGVVFSVDAGRPRVRVAGKDFVACCDTCADKLKKDPVRYLRT